MKKILFLGLVCLAFAAVIVSASFNKLNLASGAGTTTYVKQDDTLAFGYVSMNLNQTNQFLATEGHAQHRVSVIIDIESSGACNFINLSNINGSTSEPFGLVYATDVSSGELTHSIALLTVVPDSSLGSNGFKVNVKYIKKGTVPSEIIPCMSAEQRALGVEPKAPGTGGVDRLARVGNVPQGVSDMYDPHGPGWHLNYYSSVSGWKSSWPACESNYCYPGEASHGVSGHDCRCCNGGVWINDDTCCPTAAKKWNSTYSKCCADDYCCPSDFPTYSNGKCCPTGKPKYDSSMGLCVS